MTLCNRRHQRQFDYQARQKLVLVCLGVCAGLLFWRAAYLQLYDRDFLQVKSDNRNLKGLHVQSNRGVVTDRHGEPLAVSTFIRVVTFNPKKIHFVKQQLPQLAHELHMSVAEVRAKIRAHRDGRDGKNGLVYFKQRLTPVAAERVRALNITGVEIVPEARRYYPGGEIGVQLVGFTDNKDIGKEGMERVFNKRLSAMSGTIRVRRDALGRAVEEVDSVQPIASGQNVALSIDQRLQYIAYRELKTAVQKHRAVSGSLVLLDVRSGEVLAMVNSPSYNPNDRNQYVGKLARNLPIAETFHPGSTIKPFVIATALQSGKYTPSTTVDTHPGELTLGKTHIRDTRDYGALNLTEILMKSSNVGVSKIALDIGRESLWDNYRAVGFGERILGGIQGEETGALHPYHAWKQIDLASHAYGYGVSVTALQLARAYSVFARDGQLIPISLERRDTPVDGLPVINPQVARQVRQMLEQSVAPGSTGHLASVPGYRVAGKTGTVRKGRLLGQESSEHIALFAGLAPVSNPRYVMVVVINEPKSDEYYGGQVAAPVFSKVMASALRLSDIAPDNEIIATGNGVTIADGRP